ncbi:MAG: hypothetical protein J6K15_11140 [Lachnospiraceae bacterium]|nr:hypothetical protein [Lachnospiraceae bacterium]
MAWEVMPKKALTQQQIYNLYQEASRGSAKALSQLRETSAYYGKKGNERLRSFYKADISSQALKRAERFLIDFAGHRQALSGKPAQAKFSRSKKLSAYEAYLNATEARRFYRSKTGTVTKEEKRMNRVIRKLQKKGLLPKGVEGEARKNLRKFLESNAWEEIKNTFGSQTMKEISEKASSADTNYDELIEAYQQSLMDDKFNFSEFVQDWMEET